MLDPEILEHKRLIQKLHVSAKKVENKPWRSLAEAGLRQQATQACMRQDSVPISKARRKVDEYMESAAQRHQHSLDALNRLFTQETGI